MSQVKTIHTLAACTDCGYRAVLVDGRCPRCQRSLNAEQALHDATLEIGKLQATLADVAAQRDAAKAAVARLNREDDERRAAIAGIKGHWGMLAIAQLDWTKAVADLGGLEEVAQFVAEMASKEGYHDAVACAEKYQVEVVF